MDREVPVPDDSDDEEEVLMESRLNEEKISVEWQSTASNPIPVRALLIGLGELGVSSLKAALPELALAQSNLLATITLPEPPPNSLVSRNAPLKNQTCLVHSVGSDVVVTCQHEIPGTRTQEWAALLMGRLAKPSKVVVLTSFVEIDYKTEDHDPQHKLFPPLLKKLQSRAAPQLNPPVCGFLETPNIVRDAAAAVASYCQHRDISCYVFTSLRESGYGEARTTLPAMKAYHPVFQWLYREGILSQEPADQRYQSALAAIPKKQHSHSNPLFT